MNFKKSLLTLICTFLLLLFVGCSTDSNQNSLSISTTSKSPSPNPTTSLVVQTTSTTSVATTSTTEDQILEKVEEELNQEEPEEKESFNPDEAPEGEDFEFTSFEARDPELVFDESTAYLYTTNIFAVWGNPLIYRFGELKILLTMNSLVMG